MNPLPAPEEYELRASSPLLPAGDMDEARRHVSDLTPIEGLLLHLGRLINDVSTRGVQTAMERAFVKAGKVVFESLAESCGELADTDRGDARLEMVPRMREADVPDEEESLESAGGVPSAKQKKRATTKKTRRAKKTARNNG